MPPNLNPRRENIEDPSDNETNPLLTNNIPPPITTNNANWTSNQDYNTLLGRIFHATEADLSNPLHVFNLAVMLSYCFLLPRALSFFIGVTIAALLPVNLPPFLKNDAYTPEKSIFIHIVLILLLFVVHKMEMRDIEHARRTGTIPHYAAIRNYIFAHPVSNTIAATFLLDTFEYLVTQHKVIIFSTITTTSLYLGCSTIPRCVKSLDYIISKCKKFTSNEEMAATTPTTFTV